MERCYEDLYRMESEAEAYRHKCPVCEICKDYIDDAKYRRIGDEYYHNSCIRSGDAKKMKHRPTCAICGEYIASKFRRIRNEYMHDYCIETGWTDIYIENNGGY